MRPDIKSLSSHPSVGDAALSYVEFRNPITRRTPLASVFAGIEADCCEFDEACFCRADGRSRTGCIWAYDRKPFLPDGASTSRTLTAVHPHLTFGGDRPKDALAKRLFALAIVAFSFIGCVAILYGAASWALEELARFAPGVGL